MASNNQNPKKLNYGGNLETDAGEVLNNGPQYRLCNRRPGTQSLDIHYNDLSDDNSSSSEDEETQCEGCLEEKPTSFDNAYQCDYWHMFCDTCANQDYCPCHPEYPRKPGH